MADMTYLDGIILEWCEYSHLDWARSKQDASLSAGDAEKLLDSFTSFLSANSALPPDKTSEKPPDHAQI